MVLVPSPGLVPGVYAFIADVEHKTWMAGSSPAKGCRVKWRKLER